MRLANRVLFCALAIFVLSVVAVAQTPRGEGDPRNLSPAVGTGTVAGGPTGLFTIYDGQTLRKGEFTFSIAYSNFDRDPGNVDITEIPLSVNVGINDHLELFFNTTAYRGVKVNNPSNLSGFYLPNSRVFFTSTLSGSPPAIILAPSGPNVGTLAGTAVFRPAFCPACTTATSGATFVYFNGGQPFVAFPFSGGAGPNFGLGPGGLGTLFGFPGFNALLGAPTGGAGNYGAAAVYAGVGSPVGGILPGVVLATATLPTTALTMPTIVPVSFTVSPSYLPDAPFVNRLYGESTFSTFVGGAKWRLTGPRNPIGIALMPMYRFYTDHGGDVNGFNMLQRGASPGGDIGDFGLVLAVDGRLSKRVNVSANLGYWLNSNPKDPGGFAMLDRPDEFYGGVGLDFPINRHFQPIAEMRYTYYMGGRTPNAMNNNPVEVLGGAKFYPGGRWWGFGAWFRWHLNQQSSGNFNDADFNVPIQQITNVNVPGRGLVVIPGTTRPSTGNGLPLGFTPSSNPFGYGFQFFAGHRNSREPSVLPNQPPTVSVATSSETVTIPCPPGTKSDTCPTSVQSVQVTTTASDPDGDTLLYTYTVTGGRITGEGANVSWDLNGVTPGTYTVSVEVDDGCGCISMSSKTVTVAGCPNCVPIETPPVCPTAVAVDCPSGLIEPGTPVTFTARVEGGPGNQTYNWSVSAGTISSGQGTSAITVDTTGLAGQSVTASVELSGIDPSCNRTASCTVNVNKPPIPRKFDEYGNIRFNDEKARLDNFAVQLQNEPTSTGYIIGYGSCGTEGMTRANRAKDYLVNTRGIDASRIVTVDGGCTPELIVQLWIAPQGASAPTGDAAGVVSPCPDCKKKPARRGRGRRGEE